MINNNKQEQISAIISDMINKGVISGASYSFFTGGDSTDNYKGVAGVIEPYNKIILKENMYYDVASLTKVIGTTTRIMQFIESGKIGIDTKVNSILANFKHKDITVGNLLLHNSGLPADIEKPFTDIYIKLYETELVYNTNGKSLYSDLGFILLGFIIKEMDNSILNKSFRENIFDKLSMHNTSYIIDKKNINMYVPTELTKTRGLIQAEVHDSKAYVLGEAGSAGLFSTLNNLLLFAKSFVNGEYRILSENTINRLISTNIYRRSYGWDKKYGDDVLYHSGFTGTSILINTKKREGFILLTNRIHPSRDNSTFLEKREILNNLFLL